MRKTIIAGVSAVALSFAGTAFAIAPQSPQGQSGEAGQNQVMQAQQKLHAQGLYQGKVDGIDGPQTHAALRQFQGKNGLQQTGQLDRKTEQKLGLSASDATEGYGSSTPPAATDNGGKHKTGAGGPSGMPQNGKSSKTQQ